MIFQRKRELPTTKKPVFLSYLNDEICNLTNSSFIVKFELYFFERFKLVETVKALVRLSLVAVMSAVIAVGTLIIRIPNPMGGYFNVGDVMIFVAALTFGPFVGGVAGGLGSAIADVIGFPLFAVPTLMIKGLEGLLAGLVGNRKSGFRDVFAVVVSGCEMVLGYFSVEWLILQWGLGGALAEVPANILQIVVGGIVGIPMALVLRRRLPKVLRL
jgi:uncharacterized membrane protein